MAVSKSLRFQVFRRDNHTCQYCGGQPPDVALVVDHVIPAALGGSDEPSNLTTACRDCNVGKAASAPDESVVAAVGERERAYRDALDALAAEAAQERAATDWFREAWTNWKYDDGSHVPIPAGWRESVAVWMRRGLSRDDILALVDVAMSKEYVAHDAVYRYFAGCCWKALKDRESRAAELTRVVESVADAKRLDDGS